MKKWKHWCSQFTLYAVVAGVTLACLSSVSAQDDETPADSKPATEEEAAEEETSVLDVPEGLSAEELLDHANKVKMSRPATREEAAGYLKKQVEAVIACCDQALEKKLESDLLVRVYREKLGAIGAMARFDAEGSAGMRADMMKLLKGSSDAGVKRMVLTIELQKQGALVGGMSADERLDFTEKLFSVIPASGLTSAEYRVISGVASQAGRSVPEAGAEIYTRLSKAMETSADQQLVQRAARTLGSARRLMLPGNFMEITGTTADGEEFDWESYRGKVVLVDFWASWCGPCRREIPNMKQQLANYSDKGFAIVGVNLDKTKSKCQEYVKDEGLTWTNLMSDKPGEQGWENPLATYYGVSGIPTAILVDQEGKVVSLAARGNTLGSLLEGLLGPVETKEDTTSEEIGSDTEG